MSHSRGVNTRRAAEVVPECGDGTYAVIVGYGYEASDGLWNASSGTVSAQSESGGTRYTFDLEMIRSSNQAVERMSGSFFAPPMEETP